MTNQEPTSEWEKKIYADSVESDTTLSGKEVCYDTEYLVGYITSLLATVDFTDEEKDVLYSLGFTDGERLERERLRKVVDELKIVPESELERKYSFAEIVSHNDALEAILTHLKKGE